MFFDVSPAWYWASYFLKLPSIFYYCIQLKMAFMSFGICLMYVFIHILFQQPYFRGSKNESTAFRERKETVFVISFWFVGF